MKKKILDLAANLLSKEQMKNVKGGQSYCNCCGTVVFMGYNNTTPCSTFCSTYASCRPGF